MALPSRRWRVTQESHSGKGGLGASVRGKNAQLFTWRPEIAGMVACLRIYHI